jgi:hypothetical protein
MTHLDQLSTKPEATAINQAAIVFCALPGRVGKRRADAPYPNIGFLLRTDIGSLITAAESGKDPVIRERAASAPSEGIIARRQF